MEPLSAAVYAIVRPVRLGFTWRITGLEHVPEQGPLLLASNHISMFDPLVVAHIGDLRGRRVRFLAMAELFRKPVPRWFFSTLGHIPVERRSEAARSSLTTAQAKLRSGECIGIFPEGGVSRDLEPRPGQTGVARLAQATGVPVVPMGIWGTQRVVHPDHQSSYRLRLPLFVSVGAPLLVAEEEDIHEATDRVMAAICAEVARARTGFPAPRRGEDGWWVRAPETAVLRSRRPAPAPEAVEEVAAEPGDGAAPLQVDVVVPDVDDVFEEIPDEVITVAEGEEAREQQLRTIPFFRNLPAGALEAVASQLQPEHHVRGEVVFREGEPGETMYLVVSGQVEVLAGADQSPLAALGPGSFVGELALLLGEPRSATLRVVADTMLWSLHRRDLDVLLTEHPVIGVELSRELGRRLVATNRQLVAPPTTRFTVVFGPGTAALAAAVQARAGSAKVGVLELPGASPIGSLPEGVARLELKPLDTEVLAGMAGRDVDGITYLLLAAPQAESAVGRLAIELAEHIAGFCPVPGWVGQPGPAHVVLRGDGSQESYERVARWVTGQALGLALSSGGSKALAHVGVVKVLREAGIVIDAVAGTSGGALVAGALALGLSDEDMLARVHELASMLRFRRIDFNFLPRSALFKGVRIRNSLHTWSEGATFADTLIPCWMVATDVALGAEVIINRGPLSDAVRASMSIPGAMNPWPIGDHRCIDGAVTNPMPASVLRDAGIRLVIGSNVAGQELQAESDPHLMQIMSRILNSMEREMIKAQLPLVDVVIRPAVGPAPSFDFSRIDEFVLEGERAAREALPEIKAAVAAAT
jgi:1-acyl-sn-glycerol-3-phosphate acyltransferase